jgi:uncharacterized protein (DUF1330 family)
MPAYFVAELEIANQAGMDPYRAAVPATLEQCGYPRIARVLCQKHERRPGSPASIQTPQ